MRAAVILMADNKMAIWRAAWELKIPATEKLVLICLVDHVNANSGMAWPSVQRVSALTGLDARTIQRAVQRLVTAGHIERTDRPGFVTRYRVTIDATGAVTGPTPGTAPGVDPRHSVTPPPAERRGTPGTAPGDPRHSAGGTLRELLKNSQENTQERVRDARGPEWDQLVADIQRTYPKRAPVMTWDWPAVAARYIEGATADQLRGAVNRYALYCEARQMVGTHWVMFPGKFFDGSENAAWRQDWTIPGGKAIPAAALSQEQKIEISADREAVRMNIQRRQPTETAEQYSARIRRAIIQESILKMSPQRSGVKTA